MEDRLMTETGLPDTETMYEAFVDRDTRFDGIFYTGVKSTGIFCRPTCRARKPRRENVVFFASPQEALDHGYRPCMLCRPMEPSGEVPSWVRRLLSDLQDQGEDQRLRDRDLRQRGLSPEAVRRWFRKHHGMTFHAYARQLRINHAYGSIRRNQGVLDSALETGYDSLSGFTSAFRKTVGFAPSESRSRGVVSLTRIATPLGPMVAAAVGGKLCLLEFADRPSLETELRRVKRDFDAPIIVGDDLVFADTTAQLEEYFAGDRHVFDLPVAEFGSPFQRAVWRLLCAIPYGGTSSYADQAAAIGRPAAVRAVARANGQNRVAIVIPCHRVIGSDGKLTGYGGGLWRKRFLLDLERSTSS
jgi:AraC family transcriptional regulator, regulatory protein of adaptative response / methylated-DNA-[protein]-cysteine methyltransferase